MKFDAYALTTNTQYLGVVEADDEEAALVKAYEIQPDPMGAGDIDATQVTEITVQVVTDAVRLADGGEDK